MSLNNIYEDEKPYDNDVITIGPYNQAPAVSFTHKYHLFPHINYEKTSWLYFNSNDTRGIRCFPLEKK